MRGTRAKQIRKHSLYMTNGERPQVTYTEVKHKPKLAHSGQFNSNGTPKMFEYTPVTVMMANCERRTYQWFKDHYKAALQASYKAV